MAVWTLGIWVTRPGEEEAFIEAWTRLARWGEERFQTQRPILLQDRDHPNRFVTAGPWADAASIERFRGSEGFAQALAESDRSSSRSSR